MLTSLSFVSCQSKTRSNLEQRKVSDDDWMEKRKKGIPSSCVQAHRSKKCFEKGIFSDNCRQQQQQQNGGGLCVEREWSAYVRCVCVRVW